jgi:endonuclease/exonuclease/phosphatase family metal-dependent hydrolase
MELKIFSYNVYGLPFMSDSWAYPLATWFSDIDYDFICLQEVFTQGRVDILTKSLVENGYTVLKPNDFKERTNLISSGLLTGVKNSNWIIVSDTFITYKESAGAELVANKGFHCIELVNKKTGLPLMIMNTHMQSDNPTNYFGGCLDTKPIRRSQAQQIYDYVSAWKPMRHVLIGDLNSEVESHEEIKHLTGATAGISKHTFPSTGEDLDHVAILPKFWSKFLAPIVKNVMVLVKLKWSDHWPIHVELLLK